LFPYATLFRSVSGIRRVLDDGQGNYQDEQSKDELSEGAFCAVHETVLSPCRNGVTTRKWLRGAAGAHLPGVIHQRVDVSVGEIGRLHATRHATFGQQQADPTFSGGDGGGVVTLLCPAAAQ